MNKKIATVLIVSFGISAGLYAGPYTEPGIPGYIDAYWEPSSPAADPNAVVHPVFRIWATGYCDYLPADDTWVGGVWNDPSKALGPATGDNFDIVSLGDLSADEVAEGFEPGSIILTFADPNDPNDLTNPEFAIRNGKGYDFAVFENAFASLYTTPSGSVTGQMLAELARVEVSSDGVNFAAFPSVSLTSAPVGPYGTIEISNVYNLAGKHPNSFSICTGTPFDLDDLWNDPNVISGIVDVNDIHYVRIVDIPGSGDFFDEACEYIDPESFPDWQLYGSNHPIYDAWLTWGSGGFDLEAVGVLHPQEYSADVNLDGIVDMNDFMFFSAAWQSRFGEMNYSARCDFAESEDLEVNVLDLVVFSQQWLMVEQWRLEYDE